MRFRCHFDQEHPPLTCSMVIIGFCSPNWRSSRGRYSHTERPFVSREPHSSALALLAADDAISQFHGAEIPPEDPVQERRVVVAELLPVLMADGELIGYMEQGALVGADQFSLDQLAAFFKDARQGDEGRALVLVARASSPEQGNGMLHPGIPFAVHSAPGEPVLVAGRAGFVLDELPGYAVLDFNAFDAWFEEDERIYGHPRDRFHRVDVRRSSRPLRIELDGQVLAETTNTRMLFETRLPTRFYIPKEDVAVGLRPSARRSYCPYKGQASYWSSDAAEDIAWSYEDPLAELAVIKGLVAFWDERVDVILDGQSRSRPGGAVAAALADEFGVS